MEKLTRQEMQDNLVKMLGLEDEFVVMFFGFCEDYPETELNDKRIYNLYKAYMDLVEYCE